MAFTVAQISGCYLKLTAFPFISPEFRGLQITMIYNRENIEALQVRNWN